MTYSVITKTSVKNQITLPKKMMDAMSANSTTPLSITFKNNRIIIESINSKLDRIGGFLKDKIDPKLLGISDQKLSELIDSANEQSALERYNNSLIK